MLATLPSPTAPRRSHPIAYCWPLLGLGMIGLLYEIVGLGAQYLLPVSTTAHAILYFLSIFVLIPALYLGIPLLLLIQIALLVRYWRDRRRGQAA